MKPRFKTLSTGAVAALASVFAAAPALAGGPVSTPGLVGLSAGVSDPVFGEQVDSRSSGIARAELSGDVRASAVAWEEENHPGYTQARLAVSPSPAGTGWSVIEPPSTT